MEIIIYLVVINTVSIAITVYDKFASIHIKNHRISEKTLFILAAIGGAASMYITMQTIRHKTLHKQFMIGLPCIIFLHIIVFVLYVNLFS